jgi:hypothetical protein
MTWLDDLVRVRIPVAGEASVYGVILYTDAHANVKKVLRDEDYWKALDNEAGVQLTVYAIRATAVPALPRDALRGFTAVRREPRENEELLEEFDLDDSRAFPLLVVFANEDTQGWRSLSIPLTDRSQDDAYNSLKEAVGLVSSALKGVDEDRLRTEGAYNAVRYTVKGYKEKKAIARVVEVVERLKSFVA